MSEEQKPWIVTGDRWEWSVKREGSDPDDSYFLAHYEEPESLAARLNDLDTARARIALLTERLDALCGAANAKIVFDDHDVLDACMCEMCTLGRALTAAREVLGG